MKVTVIGTINKDLILPFHGMPIESFGGIFYDISVLSQLMGPDDEIVPVSYVGEDIDETLRVLLAKMPNVRTDGLITVPEKNHKVILEYISPHRRHEKSLFQFPALEWRQVAPFVEADMIVVNMISGWDLTLAAYQKLSDTACERLYIDIHYLTMGIDALGRRTPREPERITDWLRGSRFVQMNEDEYQLLAGDAISEIDFYSRYMDRSQVLLTTRGSRGAVATYERDKMVGQREFSAFPVEDVVDATGCGDAFGAGFVAKYLETDDVQRAVEFANLVGAANLSLRGTSEMHRLRATMDELAVAE